MKYVRVMNGVKSHAGGFEYKIGEVNETNHWNPLADNPEDFGGFNFSTEDKILRWLLRGDTLYDVEIPDDAEVIECENKNAPHGVFRSNKIILKNPRVLTKEIVMDLYKKSDLPENSYFQCLTFLSLSGYDEVCQKIIEEKVNYTNVTKAIETFSTFFDLQEKDKNKGFKKVNDLLCKINYQRILKEYLDIYPNEEIRLSKLKNYLNACSYAEVIDWNNFDGHIVASGIIYAKKEKKLLVLHHKDLMIDIYPGGHIDNLDRTPLEAAKREIKEETGIVNLKLLNLSNDEVIPFDIDTHKIPYNKRLDLPEHYHFDFRYLFLVDDIKRITIDNNEHSLYKWIEISEFAKIENFELLAQKIQEVIWK